MSPANDSRKLTAADVLARYNDDWLPDFGEPITDVNQVGSVGNRPIHIASYRGNMEEIEALVEGGADVNVVGIWGLLPCMTQFRGATSKQLGFCSNTEHN